MQPWDRPKSVVVGATTFADGGRVRCKWQERSYEGVITFIDPSNAFPERSTAQVKIGPNEWLNVRLVECEKLSTAQR
jgi:hypothetical protein